MHRYCIILWLCFCAGIAAAQPVSFENYDSETGLSQNSGYALAQTPEGFIWMGTQNGLNRYDSHSFFIYKHSDESNSLCHNFITALCTDGRGNLWIGTENGLCIYDRFSNRFNSPAYLVGADSLFKNMVVTRLKAAGTDKVWVVTKAQGIFLINIQTHTISNYLAAEGRLHSFRDITTDAGNQVWVSTENDIYQWASDHFEALQVYTGNRKDLIFQDILLVKNKLLVGTVSSGVLTLDLQSNRHELSAGEEWLKEINTGKEITRLYKDSKGNTWIGTAGNGLYLLDGDKHTIAHFRHQYNNTFSIGSDYILSLFEDKQGILWIGTSGGGFSKFDKQKLLFPKVSFISEDGASSNMILNLFNDTDSTVYAGTLSGGLIKTDLHFNRKTIFKNSPGNPHSLLHNTIYGIARDNRGLLWLATKAGLCSYNPALPADDAFTSYAPGSGGTQIFFCSIIKLQHENSLLVSGYNGMFRFSLDTHTWVPVKDSTRFFSSHTITARYMKELPGNTVLVCTEGDGLLLYNYQSGQLNRFDELSRYCRTVRHAQVWQQRAWLATDNGLLCVDLATKKVTAFYNSTNLLKDDVVYAILPGRRNDIWISTNTGLARIDTVLKKCKYYDVGLGLQGMEFNTACCFSTGWGDLCFGGVNGLNIFNPDSIPDKLYTAPPLITGITVLNSPLQATGNINFLQSISLPYNRNFIEFSFAMPNFSYSEKNMYAYKLAGVDTGWVYCGNRQVANYTELKPGTYTFRIKAANSNGDWSESKIPLTVTIRPPWWATWWARLAGLLLLLTGLYFFVRWRTGKIRQQEKTKALLLQYELKALHAQMNPHFIFNCLASIKQLVLDGDTPRANKYLTKFSTLIRQTLDHSKQSFISLRQNNEYLYNYFEMEQLRFDESFSFQFLVADGIDQEEWFIPPLIIQPLVENAIWHGLRPANYRGEVLVKYQAVADKLVCIIEDNGIGLQEKKEPGHQSYGVSNIEQRLQLLQQTYHTGFSLKITDKKTLNAGTTGVRIELVLSQPINTSSNE